MSRNKTYLALDVGEKRIGVAIGDEMVRIALPHGVIEVDGTEFEQIARYVVDEEPDAIVIGYPRNQAGEPTAQTASIEAFAEKLKDIAPKIIFQDESLTSVLAEQRLQSFKKPFSRGEVDAQAAALILQDYLEEQS